jgi:hypothetical protein
MVFRLVIKPIVLIDADEAIEYYEKKLQGLGKRFYLSFLRCLEDIQSSPFTYSFIKDPVRRHLIEKFPYKVYYIVTDETIFVIGVSHAKRSNAFIKRRLKLFE